MESIGVVPVLQGRWLSGLCSLGSNSEMMIEWGSVDLPRQYPASPPCN